ncbi:hypothetical protein HUJ04_004631 [Dendroctonus ponderosae]|uniref:Uncharacterized protein n=1 Tax=Dendroctonus ponderosae TaxID=77166 RepID=A0AAR5P462_DENPD|nr:hypothetical protein HUJ04_004631 [Dendroctonus ponderosae]KAH1007391.1 hypothetical protein HUJ04_004631 [Dendroctonus ponderosae]
MENNATSRDRIEQSSTRGMSHKSSSLSDSPSKIRVGDTKDSTPISPLRMPDLPLPTPPPMANIIVTSRIGYRRILGGRANEYRSPILGSRSHSMDFGSRIPSFSRTHEPLGSDWRSGYSRNDDGSRHSCFEAPGGNRMSNVKNPELRENRASTVEFMSPILTRAYLYHRDNLEESQSKQVASKNHQALLSNQLGLSPLPRHRNFENLSKRLEDFSEYPIYPEMYTLREQSKSTQQKSKYLSRDSVLSNELEEVRTLNQELQKKYVGNTEDKISRILGGSNCETSPDYYSVFFNEHYISDIDENEEIKEFVCGYKAPERRYSDQPERTIQKSKSSSFCTYQSSTLPLPPKETRDKKCSKQSNTASKAPKRCQKRNLGLPRTSSEDFTKSSKRTQPVKTILKNSKFSSSSDRIAMDVRGLTGSSETLPLSNLYSYHSDSASSMKSSDYYSFVPAMPSCVKRVEFSGDSTGKVIKSPQRTVVKLAKIRYQGI